MLLYGAASLALEKMKKNSGLPPLKTEMGIENGNTSTKN